MNYIFYTLWLIATILFFYIIYNLSVVPLSLNTPLLVPLGVLISAMLASISVMKSIKNSIEIEKSKRDENKINSKKYLNYIVSNIKHEIDAFKILYESSIESNLRKLKLSDEEPIQTVKLTMIIINPQIKFFIKESEHTLLSLTKLLEKIVDKDIIYYLNISENELFKIEKTTNVLTLQIKNCIRDYEQLVNTQDRFDIEGINHFVNTLNVLNIVLEKSQSNINDYTVN